MSNGAKSIGLTHSVPPFQLGLVTAWYAGNTFYNIYNKKATNMIHAHWFVACAQLVVGIVWSAVMWGSGMRKKPNLSAQDIAACIPIGLGACVAHAGSVLAMGSGSVRYEEDLVLSICASPPSCSAFFLHVSTLIFSASLRYLLRNPTMEIFICRNLTIFSSFVQIVKACEPGKTSVSDIFGFSCLEANFSLISTQYSRLLSDW